MAAAHPTDNPTPQHRERSVLSLTKYIPYPSVPHAGGQYVLAHDRALRGVANVTNLAPNIPLNREALPLVADGPPAALLDGAPLDGMALKLWRLESVLAGSSIYWPVRRLFAGDRAPWKQLAEADAIEFQWSEMIALAPAVRRRLPNIPLIGIGHDIVTQRLDRQAAGAGSALRRALLRFAAARSRKREAASFAALDLLIVLSEKDADLARSLAPGLRVEVVPPGLSPNDPLPRAPHADEPIVLFTGAMNRPENSDAAIWFIDEIWPRVHEAVPKARFVIAGAKPSDTLAAKVASSPRTSLTGFVDSLEPYYAEASVFVAPLRSGAGVKFKTIDAMLRGVPTVATSVGAEGIDAPELFAGLSDQSAELADTVIASLKSPNEELTRKAQVWAESVYGVDAFEQRIRELYADVIDTK